jgi:hypothetical protein
MVKTTVVKTRRRHRESNPKPVADKILLWGYSRQYNICHSGMPALMIVELISYDEK